MNVSDRPLCAHPNYAQVGRVEISRFSSGAALGEVDRRKSGHSFRYFVQWWSHFSRPPWETHVHPSTPASIGSPRDPSRATPNHGDAPVAVGRALQCDRAMARARERDDYPSLRRSRPRNEAEGARLTGATRHTDTSVSGAGFTHAFPADAVTMRSTTGLNSGRCCDSQGVCA